MRLLMLVLTVVSITCFGVVFTTIQVHGSVRSTTTEETTNTNISINATKSLNSSLSGISFSIGVGKLPTTLQRGSKGGHPLWEGGRVTQTQRPCVNDAHLKGSWIYDSDLIKLHNYDGLGTIPGCCGRAAKYITNTTRTAGFYRWQPEGCDLIPFSEKEFCLGLNGRNIMFVGDSLNELWHFSILHALGAQGNLSDAEGTSKGKPRCPKHPICKKYYPKPLLLYHVTNHFLELVHVKRVSRDWKDEINNFGIIIMNSGSWMVNPVALHHGSKVVEVTENMFTAYMRRTAEFLRKNYNGVVVFRTNYAGHPECQNYDKPLTEPLPRPYPKKWEKYNWESIPSRNKRATGIFKRAGAFILNIEPMTSLRPDGHISVWHPKNYLWKGTNATKITSDEATAVDCLHYCVPGPMDAWSVLLLNLLVGNIL
eukprot:TRINITY_DN24644_c0_g1_i1.p1 TRINITY_DN24644_c0_g1~~TRINITY_DN24644_c0_g1_i1.p1  ORF type:complete len:425 (+),score=65.11 TRINITY_DN24644_c0_g1_i1:166-1440(+)